MRPSTLLFIVAVVMAALMLGCSYVNIHELSYVYLLMSLFFLVLGGWRRAVEDSGEQTVD